VTDTGIDRELDLRRIVWTGVGLALLLIVTVLLVWPLAGGMRSLASRLDSAEPALPEAMTQPVPPGPRLQIDPAGELAEMRHEEAIRLGTYAWVNEPAGIARIPVERAMEIVLERGLESRPESQPDSDLGVAPTTATEEGGQ
jgi:hypothetical protein